MDLVLDVPHAPEVLGQVLGEPLRVTVRNASGERHLAVHHANFNVARVEIPMPRHPFADVLPDAFVRPLITTRPAADEFTARSPLPRAAGFVAAPVRVPHRLPVARRRTIPFSGTPAAATLAFDLSPLSSPVPVDRLVA